MYPTLPSLVVSGVGFGKLEGTTEFPKREGIRRHFRAKRGKLEGTSELLSERASESEKVTCELK